MSPETIESCTSFEGSRRIASGTVAEVAARTKRAMDRGVSGPILIFDDATAQPVEIDFRGTVEAVLGRLPSSSTASTSVKTEPGPVLPRGPGRPKLGVVAREVTLLPRHWEWLNGRPGGASVALRKLVEAARKSSESDDRVRRSQEASYRFMTAIAGNLAGFEEAIRALFAGDRRQFQHHVKDWPADLRDHASKLADPALDPPS
jgi:hypothetical protein